MPDWGCGAYNRGHLADSCKCHKSKQRKGFYSSLPRYHPDKPYKKKRKHRYHVSKKYNKPPHKRFVKRRTDKNDKETCFIYGQKGHWANKCPKNKSKPRLVSFCEQLDPRWWDLHSDGESPSSEVIFLPSDASSVSEDSESENDKAALQKLAPSSSSSDSDSEPKLGGFEPPDYDFSLYMFSANKPQNIEKQIAAIDMQLSETPTFEYMLRASLKEEKKQLLKKLEQDKGKGIVSHVTPALYNPIELYKKLSRWP